MLFHDRALIDGPARITREGHFVAKARVARANNVQDYAPHELGLPPKADGSPYRIFRPADAIFAKDSLASALHRPIVIGHPSEDVTAKNWKALSVGDTGGEIMRDGDTMVVPIMVMDAKGVGAVQSTHPEFSWGYEAGIDMTPGTFGDQAYDGSITSPRYNHLAMCPRARGGADLRVQDSLVIIDERPANISDSKERTMKIKIGDAEVDLADGAAVALAVGSLNSKLADAEGKVGTLTADLATAKTTIEAKDGEIAALEQKVKDAEVSPEKLQQMADARAQTVIRAKALKADLIADGKTDAAIRKEAVTAKLGDAAKDMSDAAIDGAFTALTKDVKAPDALRDAIAGAPVSVSDAATDYQSSRMRQKQALRDAWKTPATADAA